MKFNSCYTSHILVKRMLAFFFRYYTAVETIVKVIFFEKMFVIHLA